MFKGIDWKRISNGLPNIDEKNISREINAYYIKLFLKGT